MRKVSVAEAREQLGQLLAAVEAGEEIVIVRHGVSVAKLVPVGKPMSPFLDRTDLRGEIPPMTTTAEATVRRLRDGGRY